MLFLIEFGILLQEMRERLRPKNDTPWFKNFMEFANALYKLTKEQRWDGKFFQNCYNSNKQE